MDLTLGVIDEFILLMYKGVMQFKKLYPQLLLTLEKMQLLFGFWPKLIFVIQCQTSHGRFRNVA
jgi:hypothetical protein